MLSLAVSFVRAGHTWLWSDLFGNWHYLLEAGNLCSVYEDSLRQIIANGLVPTTAQATGVNYQLKLGVSGLPAGQNRQELVQLLVVLISQEMPTFFFIGGSLLEEECRSE